MSESNHLPTDLASAHAEIERLRKEKAELEQELASTQADKAMLQGLVFQSANLTRELADRLQVHSTSILKRSVMKSEALPELFRSFDDFDLSVRSQNALREAGIEYIWQFLTKTEKELKASSRGFTQNSIIEIRGILFDLGLGSVKLPRDFVPPQP